MRSCHLLATNFLTFLIGHFILRCLQGKEGVVVQHKLIKPFLAAGVRLFVPSELAIKYTDTEYRAVPWNKLKLDVQIALREAGITTTSVLSGAFAELIPALGRIFGINEKDNKLEVYGDPKAPFIFRCVLLILCVFDIC